MIKKFNLFESNEDDNIIIGEEVFSKFQNEDGSYSVFDIIDFLNKKLTDNILSDYTKFRVKSIGWELNYQYDYEHIMKRLELSLTNKTKFSLNYDEFLIRFFSYNNSAIDFTKNSIIKIHEPRIVFSEFDPYGEEDWDD